MLLVIQKNQDIISLAKSPISFHLKIWMGKRIIIGPFTLLEYLEWLQPLTYEWIWLSSFGLCCPNIDCLRLCVCRCFISLSLCVSLFITPLCLSFTLSVVWLSMTPHHSSVSRGPWRPGGSRGLETRGRMRKGHWMDRALVPGGGGGQRGATDMKWELGEVGVCWWWWWWLRSMLMELLLHTHTWWLEMKSTKTANANTNPGN